MKAVRVYVVTTEPSNGYSVPIVYNEYYDRKQRAIVLFP